MAVKYHKDSHKYSNYYSYVYPLGGEFITNLNKNNARLDFVSKVSQIMAARKPNTYEDAVKLATLLGIDGAPE